LVQALKTPLETSESKIRRSLLSKFFIFRILRY
jgi:hypothetical protein